MIALREIEVKESEEHPPDSRRDCVSPQPRRERARTSTSNVPSRAAKRRNKAALRRDEQRAKRRNRGALMLEVAEVNLDDRQLRSFKSSGSIGKGRQTVRERLRVELQRHRDGVPIDADSRLWVESGPAIDKESGDEYGKSVVLSSPIEPETFSSVASQERSIDIDERQGIPFADMSEHEQIASRPEKLISRIRTGEGEQVRPADEYVSARVLPDLIKRSTRSRLPRVKKVSRKEVQERLGHPTQISQELSLDQQKLVLEAFLQSFQNNDLVENEASSASSDEVQYLKPSSNPQPDSESTFNQDKSPQDAKGATGMEKIARASVMNYPIMSSIRVNLLMEKNEPPFMGRVERTPAFEKARMQLPVCGKEQEIMEAIYHHNVVFISGETGSGKTTQVPQFLYEAGFGWSENPISARRGTIVVAQPRRIAAVACARRVAEELNVTFGKEVGYQIRHQRGFDPDSTKIKFVTDGVLLREIEHDILARRYSAIILDEAHERTLNSDLLAALLSRSVSLRSSNEEFGPLKLVIMSANLDIQGFIGGENPVFQKDSCPLIQVDTRQYPVTTHFSRRTKGDYINAAFQKACKLHKKLPAGDVLIFVTGRLEVMQLVRKLNQIFTDRNSFEAFPLYANLPEQRQGKILSPSSPQKRRVIVATNVAETSLTIPGIRYVIDTGKVKEVTFRGSGGASMKSYEVNWISKASANQRAGRSGRIGPGHCYRLYSSAVFDNEFADQRVPEILRIPSDTLVLRLLAMGIRRLEHFPFPTRPDEESLKRSMMILKMLGVIDESDATLSQLGSKMAGLPLSPRLSCVLLFCSMRQCASLATRLVAGLCVGEIFVQSSHVDGEMGSAVQLKKPGFWKRFAHPMSEAFSLLRAICAAEVASVESRDSIERFFSENNLNGRNIREALDIARQLEAALTMAPSNFMAPPSEEQELILRMGILSGFPDQVARRMSGIELVAAGLTSSKLRKRAFHCPHLIPGRPVLLAEGSSVPLDTDYVCFTELIEHTDTDFPIMRGSTIVSPSLLARVCAALCSFESPSVESTSMYSVVEDKIFYSTLAYYGPQKWPLGSVQVPFPSSLIGKLDILRYQAFSDAFLSGIIFDSVASPLADLFNVYKNDRTRYKSRAIAFSLALQYSKVSSRVELSKCWECDPMRFMAEVREIFIDVLQDRRISGGWPPTVAKIAP